jgi:hypothetical protein
MWVHRFAIHGLIVVTAALAAPAPLTAQDGEAGVSYEFRYGIPDGTSLATLSDEPEVVDFRIAEDPDFSKAGVASLVEYHAVYPLPLEALLATITAYGEYVEISRRVTESSLLEPPANPPYGPIGTVAETHAALMRTSFKFLFFGRNYDYELSSMTESLEDDERLVRSKMTRSIDGGLGAIHYSWYLEPVGSADDPRTYVRYFARVDFAEEPRGLELALELFARSDVERLLESIYRHARRR